MNKRILIPLMVCVLAIGTMGAAFATTMSITGVGALSEGTQTIPTVNVDDVSYNLDDYGSVAAVVLSFNTDLAVGTEIAVQLTDGTTTLASGKKTLGGALAHTASTTIDLNGDPVDTVDQMTKIKVVVAE